MVIIKLFIVLFSVVYLHGVIICATDNYRMNKLKSILANFLKATKVTQDRYYNRSLTRSEHYSKARNRLLESYPLICRVLPVYRYGCLSYNKTDFELHDTAEEIYHTLLMEHNFVLDNLQSSFNPFYTLRTIFRFPSIFLKWIGFNYSGVTTKIINILGWVIPLVLSLYSAEIKVLIAALIQNFTN